MRASAAEPFAAMRTGVEIDSRLAEPQPGHNVRVSRISVTTRSSSSADVTPLFTLARPSSPSGGHPAGDCRIAQSIARGARRDQTAQVIA